MLEKKPVKVVKQRQRKPDDDEPLMYTAVSHLRQQQQPTGGRRIKFKRVRKPKSKGLKSKVTSKHRKRRKK